MYYTIYWIGITVQIFQMFIFIQCQCPEYFRYFRNETTEEIMGTVEIPSPPRGVPLHLHVILNVATVLPTVSIKVPLNKLLNLFSNYNFNASELKTFSILFFFSNYREHKIISW